MCCFFLTMFEAKFFFSLYTQFICCVLFSHVQLFATPWTVAHQAPLSLEFSRQEYWSGLPFPSPGDLPDPGIKPGSPALQADSLPSEPPGRCVCSIDTTVYLIVNRTEIRGTFVNSTFCS